MLITSHFLVFFPRAASHFETLLPFALENELNKPPSQGISPEARLQFILFSVSLLVTAQADSA